jgi:hypothetical protein
VFIVAFWSHLLFSGARPSVVLSGSLVSGGSVF